MILSNKQERKNSIFHKNKISEIIKSAVCTNVNDPSLFEIIIWNPSSKTHFILPQDDPHEELNDFMCANFCFGYGCFNDDFKVVKMVDYFHVEVN